MLMIHKVRSNIVANLIETNMTKSNEYTTLFEIAHGTLHRLYLNTYFNSRMGTLSVDLDEFTIKINIYSTNWQTNTPVHGHLGLQW